MEQKKSNIDDYFRQKFLGFEPKPPEKIWEGVKEDLKRPPEISKGHLGFRYYMAVAASVTILAAIGYLFWSPTKNALPHISENGSARDTSSRTLHVQQDGRIEKTLSTSSQQEKQEPVPSEQIPKEILPQRISTTAKKLEFYLPDSSKVYLNRNSEISYDFNGKREVTISKGEVYFEVRKQNGQQFIVKSNYSTTEVLGTSFMIRSNPIAEKDELYVISGKVAFSPLPYPAKKLFLGPMEKGILEKYGALSQAKIVEENYNAWKTEEIVFENTPLTEVIATLEHYYGVSLQITNPEILTCHFTGRFEKSSLNEVIQVLAATFNLSFDDKQGMYTLSGKGCN